ncbi:MAG: AmmeMemoRadiSam system radical SAM enzyme [Candidatus Omnitrophica bacterium]|nr:AmmeMemoRadiSam system radical SAM enzyme [Candidatus Omnitrophota bacterium]MCM8793786.1 AmmeMemoRadiSam system radical SAM enzyme [Candidatus Omnitrophota bacterium]
MNSDKTFTRRDFIKRACLFCLGWELSGLLGSILRKGLSWGEIILRQGIKEAMFYKTIDEETVQCFLCPRNCVLLNGQRSFCRVREAEKGKLYSLVYGLACSVHIDPIEKKPIFHLLPGSASFSIATAGCNLRCKFCQNWTISQMKPEEVDYIFLPPEEIVKKTIEKNCASIAYTYSEPTIFYEYMLDTAKLAQEKNIKNIYVTAGYINPEPAKLLAEYIDAANIDLKAYDDEYLQNICAQRLEPLLQAIKLFKELGVWVEITNLILPSLNDDLQKIRQMCLWIKENLGPDTPLHFSRFFPMYKMTHLPPTPVSTLEEARKVAQEVGLNYVYIGNVPGHPGENTYCPQCKAILIERRGFFLTQYHLNKNRCKFCGQEIAGIWPDKSPLL